MDMIIYPSKLNGVVEAPPSKSYTHRYYFIGLLSNGFTEIRRALKSKDTEATLNAVREFGAEADWSYIKGGGLKTPHYPINCIRSGTTCRFAMAIASLVEGPTLLVGDKQLMRRPMKELVDALKDMGIRVNSNNGYLPIEISEKTIINRNISISGKRSSQFISALLILGTKVGLDIYVKDQVKSKGYIDITLKTLKEAGAKLYVDKYYKYFHVEHTDLVGRLYNIPGDYSSAANLIAAASINGHIKITGLSKDDIQPDMKIINVVKKMGANVIWREYAVEIESDTLEGIEIDCSSCPDLLPIISVLGAYAKGKTILKNVEHVRYKESDRIKTSIYNLRRMGVETIATKDGLVIYGNRERRNQTIFNSFNDHRIALAFIVASLFLEKKSIVTNIDIIEDSYPLFFNHISSLGARFTLI